MKYILKNKDIAVLEFEVEKQEDIISAAENIKEIRYEITNNIKILNEKLLPITFLFYEKENNNLKLSLKDWIKYRRVPTNRKFVKNIMDSYKKGYPLDYIDISLGLSLNDSYWIIPSDKDYKWKDYNLYDNKFSEILELVAFNGESHKIKGITSSPEYTTNGMLRKCWHRENNIIYLYKGSSYKSSEEGICRNEAYNEYYMAQIAQAMNFSHISYDLKEFHNQIVSSCEIFTNENEGYVPMSFLVHNHRDLSQAEFIEKVSKIYGEKPLQNLLLFDSIIYNIDRHLGNFGMIINNNTNEILRPAPIFDNGLSIFYLADKTNLVDLKDHLSQFRSKFKYPFDSQMKKFVRPRHIESLEKLSTFTFKRHEKYNLDETWLKPIESHIQDRAKLALALAKEKKQALENAKSKSQNLNNQGLGR